MAKNTVEPAIASAEVLGGITLVGICHLFKQFYGEDWFSVGYDKSTDDMKEWIAQHNATYYAAPRENFSKWSAVEKAHREGKRIVVIEDLS